MTKRFTEKWEPTLIDRSILVTGTWWYDNVIPWKIELIRDKYDYTSRDLEDIEKSCNYIVTEDLILNDIDESGQIFYWKFSNPNGGASESKYFGNYGDALNHIKTYGKFTLNERHS